MPLTAPKPVHKISLPLLLDQLQTEWQTDKNPAAANAELLAYYHAAVNVALHWIGGDYMRVKFPAGYEDARLARLCAYLRGVTDWPAVRRSNSRRCIRSGPPTPRTAPCPSQTTAHRMIRSLWCGCTSGMAWIRSGKQKRVWLTISRRTTCRNFQAGSARTFTSSVWRCCTATAPASWRWLIWRPPHEPRFAPSRPITPACVPITAA